MASFRRRKRRNLCRQAFSEIPHNSTTPRFVITREKTSRNIGGEMFFMKRPAKFPCGSLEPKVASSRKETLFSKRRSFLVGMQFPGRGRANFPKEELSKIGNVRRNRVGNGATPKASPRNEAARNFLAGTVILSELSYFRRAGGRLKVAR